MINFNLLLLPPGPLLPPFSTRPGPRHAFWLHAENRSYMQAKIKNILLVCSDAKESVLLQDFLSHLPSNVHITVAATSQELTAFLKKAIPDIIVMRMDNEEEGNKRFLNVIRKDDRLDDIPVFVYNISPGKKDLRSLLKKWRKVLSYLPL